MGKIVANFFATADGVVESPHEWHFPFHSDEVGEVLTAGMQTQRTFLLGRTMYDQWSEYWPASKDEPFASYINNAPKYVLTHRPIDGPLWNNTTVLGPDPLAEIRTLKQGDGDIGMSGCMTTVRYLVSEGLVDEINLLIDPIMVGAGQRLFDSRVTLRLLSSVALTNGVQHVRYAPVS